MQKGKPAPLYNLSLALQSVISQNVAPGQLASKLPVGLSKTQVSR